MLFSLCYVILHWFVAYSAMVLSAIRNTAENFMFALRKWNVVSEFEYLQNITTLPRKFPVHIAFVIDEDEIEYLPSISKAVNWAIFAGVRFVTLFDCKGQLIERAEELEKALESHRRQWLLCSSRASVPSFRLFCNDNAASSKDMHPAKNLATSLTTNSQTFDPSSCASASSSTPSYVRVELISCKHGRWNIVELCRRYCAGRTTQSELSHDWISQNLCLHDVPEPSMIVCFGKNRIISMHGFPPWQSRLSEIVHLGPLKELRCSSFVSALDLFAGTEQRFGT